MDADLFCAIMDDNATMEQLEAMKAEKERATREANEKAAADAAARAREELIRTDPYRGAENHDTPTGA